MALKDDSLLIPIEDEYDRQVGWIKRQPNGKLPKYLYQEGFSKSLVVFGLGNFYKNQQYNSGNKYVIITEGPLDAIWLTQNGYPAVAIMGVTMSYYQERLIKNTNATEFVLCLDNDEAGKKGTIKINDRLSKSGIVTATFLPDEINDIQNIRDCKYN